MDLLCLRFLISTENLIRCSLLYILREDPLDILFPIFVTISSIFIDFPTSIIIEGLDFILHERDATFRNLRSSSKLFLPDIKHLNMKKSLNENIIDSVPLETYLSFPVKMREAKVSESIFR